MRTKGVKTGLHTFNYLFLTALVSNVRTDIILILIQKYNEAARSKRRRRTVLYVEELVTKPTKLDD
ncbi:hypothetical protein [Candidatus Magnetomonas plexicatena]|uniref:hypothetical protein n=1 Tax=Candidatus Magnetomonas plexicatena TaxID=2552947 RepID=UPI001C76C761|nr:hypothetical protein E2O03_007020 [Nitrospirales bacterium LBB_01]